jgi:hypothetical protein
MEQAEPWKKQVAGLTKLISMAPCLCCTMGKAALNSRQNKLRLSLASAILKFNELREPSIETSNSSLYKQPESNLPSWLKVLSAAATSNILTSIESKPLALNKGGFKNAQLLKSTTVNPTQLKLMVVLAKKLPPTDEF